MSIYAWIKLFMPLALDYIKEVCVPGTDNRKTTPIERISILAIIMLFALLGYASQSIFALHTEKMSVQLELAKAEVRLEAMQKELDETRADLTIARILPTTTTTDEDQPPVVTYDGRRTTVVIEKAAPAPIVIDKSLLHKKMTDAINEYQ